MLESRGLTDCDSLKTFQVVVRPGLGEYRTSDIQSPENKRWNILLVFDCFSSGPCSRGPDPCPERLQAGQEERALNWRRCPAVLQGEQALGGQGWRWVGEPLRRDWLADALTQGRRGGGPSGSLSIDLAQKPFFLLHFFFLKRKNPFIL